MSRLIVDIKDESKKGIIIDLLKELTFVTVKEHEDISKKKTTAGLESIFGLWKDREIDFHEIRKKTWKISPYR